MGMQLGYVHARLLGSVGHTFGVERDWPDLPGLHWLGAY